MLITSTYHRNRQLWLTASLIYFTGICSVAIAGDNESGQSSLRIAWSSDGLEFTDSGRELLDDATRPSVVRRRNGEMILLYERVDKEGDSDRTRLSSMRSRNDGRRWSRPKTVQIRDRLGRRVHGQLGTIVLTADERVRLFFFRDDILKDSKDGDTVSVLSSAISRDGVHFRLDDFFHVEGLADSAHGITAAWMRDRLHLYLTHRTRKSSGGSAGLVTHAVSADGRRFVAFRREKMGGVNFEGSIIRLGKGYRAYAWNKSGIRSFRSANGRSWQQEEGVRLADGAYPAVVALDKPAWLMVYAYVGEQGSAPSNVGASDQLTDVYDINLEGERDKSVNAEDSIVFTSEEGSANQNIITRENVSSDGELVVGVEGSSAGAFDSDSNGDDAYLNIEAPATYRDGTPISDEYGFAPLPNFRDEVDYIKWWESVAASNASGRTYDLQEAIRQTVGDDAWPEGINMFTDPDFYGSPGPWDPTARPRWETSRLAFAALRSRFEEAADYDGYSDKGYSFSHDSDMDDDFNQLLLGILLPNLSHHRAISRSILSDAWRAPGGKVSSKRMLDAWRTTLINARHAGQGATLIEDLVAMAERRVIQHSARWALKHGIFSDEKIDDALELLKRYDRPARDPMLWIRGEHAMVMDVTQYLFAPLLPGRDQPINKERVETFIDQSWVEEDVIERLSSMTRKDGLKVVHDVDEYYRRLGEMMRIGYPDVRVADLEALEQLFDHQTPLTKELLPSLSRYYQLRTRIETSRRATQLIYAVHVFKVQEDRWPKSLDELPAHLSGGFLIDPFSGEDFIYRLGPQGPRIYSVSENGEDDGGVHDRRWGDRPDEHTSLDDYVFWPPQP